MREASDWYFDHVIFLPLELARRRCGPVKFIALCVYPPWFFVFTVIGFPLLMCAILADMWDSLND